MVTRSHSTVFGTKKKKAMSVGCFINLAFSYSIVRTAFVSSSTALDSSYTSAQVSLGRKKSLYPQNSISTRNTVNLDIQLYMPKALTECFNPKINVTTQ